MADLNELPESPFERLRAIVAVLRSPEGCPWDREQTHESLRAGLIEEAYEVIDAITQSDDENLREELGDLLLQVIFHADLAEDRGAFTLDDAAWGVCEKLIRRHPHVFGEAEASDTKEVLRQWEQIKREEKGEGASLLDGISRALPALTRTGQVQKKVARIGFDWAGAADVIDKFREEVAELSVEIEAGDREKIENEIGDIFFTAVNIARKLGVDPELALERTTQRFISRFQWMEKAAEANGKKLEDSDSAELEELWEEAKEKLSGEKPSD